MSVLPLMFNFMTTDKKQLRKKVSLRPAGQSWANLQYYDCYEHIYIYNMILSHLGSSCIKISSELSSGT